jgi:AcrR family transcriptional regulator
LSPRKIPTQARARETYLAIRQAAARILQRDGYSALTSNHIAAEAGVGIASFYEYFPNKQAVVAAVVTSTVEEVLGALEASLGKALAQTPEAGLGTWVSAMFSALDERRALATRLLREVPFLYDVPAMQALPRKLVRLATRGQALGGNPAPLERGNALSYLLPVMVSSAVVESVVRPPRGIPRSELEQTLVNMLKPLLAASF